MFISILELDKLPSFCGIYLIFDADDNVVYVGRSINIRKRWLQGHHIMHKLLQMEHHQNMRIKCVEINKKRLNHAEYLAVKFYQPVLNQKQPSII